MLTREERIQRSKEFEQMARDDAKKLSTAELIRILQTPTHVEETPPHNVEEFIRRRFLIIYIEEFQTRPNCYVVYDIPSHQVFFGSRA